MQRCMLFRLCIFIISEPNQAWQVLGLTHTFLIRGFKQYSFLWLLLSNHRYARLCISQQVMITSEACF